MIQPTAPEALRLALALAALTLTALGLYLLRRRRVAAALGDRELIRQLLGFDLGRAPLSRLVVIAASGGLIGAAIVMAAAAAGRAGTSGPVVLLLDASGSMLVADAGGRRLEAQRRAASQIADRLDGSSAIGIVAFAGRAFSLTPPTRDRAAVDMYISTVDPSIVTGSGSALNAAIRQGIGLLAAPGSAGRGTIVLLGDGDETEDRDAAVEAAALARRAGVRIHTVAVGSAAGGPVPALDPMSGSMEGYLRAPDGDIIESRMDDRLLRTISSQTGGGHVAAADTDAVDSLVDSIVQTTDPATSGSIPAYAWPALTALLLLLLEPLTQPLGDARPSAAEGRRTRRRGQREMEEAADA